MQINKIARIQREFKNHKALLRCAREFNIIGDPTRLKICYLLCHHKELSVGEIARIVGVSISATSHTLKKLQDRGMVENRREFRTVYYQLKKSLFVKTLKKTLLTL